MTDRVRAVGAFDLGRRHVVDPSAEVVTDDGVSVVSNDPDEDAGTVALLTQRAAGDRGPTTQDVDDGLAAHRAVELGEHAVGQVEIAVVVAHDDPAVGIELAEQGADGQVGVDAVDVDERLRVGAADDKQEERRDGQATNVRYRYFPVIEGAAGPIDRSDAHSPGFDFEASGGSVEPDPGGDAEGNPEAGQVSEPDASLERHNRADVEVVDPPEFCGDPVPVRVNAHQV